MWVGRCNECGEFGTYVEEIERPAEASAVRASRAQGVALSDVHASAAPRVSSGIDELDRVLGGGLVEGSVVLLGGEPGIGKSTLLLQAADALASTGTKVLYVCGEESPQQVAMRARRLGAASPSVTLLPELDVGWLKRPCAPTRPTCSSWTPSRPRSMPTSPVRPAVSAKSARARRD